MTENTDKKNSNRGRNKTNMYVITVMSRDRVGIVRDVTNALVSLNANIESMSQTVVMGYFTLILVITLPQKYSEEKIRECVSSGGERGEFEVSVKRYDSQRARNPVVVDGDKFILTAMGRDQRGIIVRITRYLASKRINITDLYAYKPDNNHFVLIAELDVPAELDIHQIQLDIEAIGKEIGLSATFQHQNVFRATSEISSPISY